MADDKPKKPLGELLKEKGIIHEGHIKFALQEQKITKEMLGQILERLGFVTEHDTTTTLAEQSGTPYMDVDAALPQENILKMFNKNLCLTNTFLPIRTVDRSIEVATSSMYDAKLGQIISRQTGLTPVFYLSERSKIINAINKFYYFLENPVEKLIENEVRVLSHDTEMARGMDNLINHILHMAVKMRATDIHIRPMKKSTNVAFRIDGVMTSVMFLPVTLNRLVVALKMKADMDIAEQRLPQDGRFNAVILNNNYDFRASTIVTPQGENMVLRVLPMDTAILGMGQLGFFEEHIKIVEQMFNEPFGIILLTGPTGSGKSTTLYAGIRRLNLLDKNVITVENPIEFGIPLLRQTQVNERAGYTFANAIRYFLRHDPDVILVGEIRDAETASTAVSASTTGHLVLSTMHTNSSIGAIPRLKDLGIRPFLIADSLIGVVSQRLVRKICENCKTTYAPEQWEKEYIRDKKVETLYQGQGCDVCNGTKYFGRTLVYELLQVDRTISSMIEQEEELSEIKSRAIQEDLFVSIYDTTAQKVKQGVTTVEEAIRILGAIRKA